MTLSYITLGVMELHNLGGWLTGGCGRGQVPDLVTQSVIPFWICLTKCNHILKEKFNKIVVIKKIFF